MELELRPLLRQTAAAIHASLKDHAGALPEYGLALSPGVGALLEVLDTNLPVLRTRLDDRNFSLCLRVRRAFEYSRFDRDCPALAHDWGHQWGVVRAEWE